MNTLPLCNTINSKNTIMKTFIDTKIQKIISEKCNKINK